MQKFHEVVHGSAQNMVFTLTKADGTPQNLTGATVTLYVERRRTGVIWVNGGAVTLVDPNNGVCSYSFSADWASLEATPDLGDGIYRAQAHVAGLSPTPVRFPTSHPGWFGVHVLPKVS